MRKFLTLACILIGLHSSSQVVINEVYGAGGNLNATRTHDFVELYNNSASPITMTDWAIQYTSAAGTTWASQKLTFSGVIPANGYFLIQLASGGANGTALPAADATGSFNMAAGAGKVILCNTSAAVGINTNPTDAHIIDKVAYGSTATAMEGAQAPAPSTTLSIQRNPIGFDSNNNSTDFTTGTPSPTNSVTGNTISISVSAGTAASEAPATGTFTINFSAATTAQTTIDFAYTGSAAFTTDYSIGYTAGTPNSATSSGTLTVPAGTSSITVSVLPVDDGDVEGTETVTLTLSSPATGYTLGTAAASINLADNDAPPTVSVAAGTNAAEPATNGTFQFNLSSVAPAGGVTITYTLTGTASASDYSDPQSGTVTVAAGASLATATMNVVDDPDGEPVETIILTINTVSSPYAIGTASATINLTSDDFTPISLTGIYSQDFNTLATSGTTNPLALQGWLLNETGGSVARDNEQYGADNGGSNTGDTYSYGTTSTSDRALGSLQSGTLIATYGSFYTNNTGTTITKLRVTYTGEQWRLGATGRNDRLDFQYSVNAANITTGTWTDVNGLDFIGPVSLGTVGSLDGNSSANNVLVSFEIIGLSIPNGSNFAIRWNDFNASGADDGLAIDDFSIEANPIDLTPPAVLTLAPVNGATNVPTNGSATIIFDEPVQKVTGNILIKRTDDNSIFQTISVTSPSVTVNSATVSFPLSALSINTGYYIQVDNGAFEDLSGNDFAGISSTNTWAFTTGTIFYAANFNSCTSAPTDGFTQFSVTGTIVWGCTNFGRDPLAPAGTAPFPSGMQMNGFSGTNVPNVDWLISPSFNLTGTTYPLLSFWSRTKFNGQPLQLKVSTDYVSGDPTLATWTDVNGKFPGQTSDTWTLSENINLAAFKQSNVHFAFVYVSDDDEGARWTLDDVRLDDSPTPPPPSLTVSTNDIQFAYVAAGSTANKNFTFIGNDLTNDVTLNANGSFTLSKNGSDFFSSISYTVAEVNNIPTNVFVRFAPGQNNQNFTGSIAIATGDINASINLTGTSIDPVTTLEVVNWNVEWFGSTAEGPTNENLQEQNVKTILQNLNADVYALSEIVSEERLANVVGQMPGYAYVLSNYGSHTNTTINPPSSLASAQKMAFIYKTSVLSNITTTALLSQGINSSADITSNPAYNYWASGRFPYMMSADVTLNCVTKNVKFILVHAKANTAPTAGSYDRRKKGADTLHYIISQFYANDNIVILGDFNDDLDESITDGFDITSWNIFTNDVVNYEPLTLPLSLAGKKSTVSYNDVIDHVVVSSEFETSYLPGTANILTDVSSLVTNYGSTTSDHYPVFSRFRFNNQTAPSVTTCVDPSPFCVNNTGNYTIPAFVATDDCGDVVAYSYTITGATERTGTTNNASGAFNPGTSIVNWTATDSWGNSSNCQVTVVVNTNPTVTIPDAFAMSSGVLANTVYIGYTPASSITLNAVASGGTAGYSYNWSSGSTTSGATVSPTSTTIYNVTITDANGCQATANKTVNVLDIRGGNKGKQVVLCHGGSNTLIVGQDEVATHISHGDMLGACAGNPARTWTHNNVVSGQSMSQLAVQALPNPSNGSFRIAIQTGNNNVPVTLRVTDLVGRLIEQKNVPGAGSVLTIGAEYKAGMYLVELSQGHQRQTLKLVKL